MKQLIFFKLKGCPACNHVQPIVESVASAAGINSITIDATTPSGKAEAELADVEDFPLVIIRNNGIEQLRLKGVNKIKRELPNILPPSVSQKKNAQVQGVDYKKYILPALGVALAGIALYNHLNVDDDE